MNGYERITAALRGERPDRVPVMLHNFMMAAREAGVTMKAFREDPRRMADVFIRAVETYGYDGVLVDVDTATLAGALGVPVELPEDEPALCRGARLASLAEVDDLEPPDVDARSARRRCGSRPCVSSSATSAGRSTSAATATRRRSRSRR